jgi:hypothetical protein
LEPRDFVSLPNWLWDNFALLFNEYSEAAGGNTDHSPLPSAEVKDLGDSHSLYIPEWHAQGQFYSSPFIVLQFHENLDCI